MTNPFLNEGNLNDGLGHSNTEKTVKELLKEIQKEFEFNQDINKLDTPMTREFTLINGLPHFETEYDSYVLYAEFLLKLQSYRNNGDILWLEDSIQNLNNVQLVNILNQYWNTVTKMKNPTAEEIYNYTYKLHNSKISRPKLRKIIDLALKNALNDYMQTETNLNKVKNYYIKMIVWIEDYVPLLVNKNNDYLKNIVIEGVLKRDMFDFLLILQQAGIKVLYINTAKNDIKPRNNEVLKKINSQLVLFDSKEDAVLNIERMNKRISEHESDIKKTVTTVARQVSDELHQSLHSDGNGLIKPWQFENHDVHVSRLVTTYDEIIQLWNEPSYLRSGFTVENGCVYIPSIFAKINGTHEDVERYWVDYDILTSAQDTILIKEFPFVKPFINVPRPIPAGVNGFDYDRVIKLANYPYKHLRTSIQKLLVDRMNEIIENQYIISDLRKNEYAYMILHTVLNLDNQFIQALQKFDYGQEIPKVVLYMNDTKLLNIPEAISIVLLHLIGFDIVVLAPTGYLTIENIIHDSLYEKHYKDEFHTELEVPTIINNPLASNKNNTNNKGSIIGRLMRRFINE